MSKKVLEAVKQCMEDLKISYAFHEWSDKPTYPYWVGEYVEVESVKEDGEQDTTFYLNGFARGSTAYQQLETDKEKIENLFNGYGQRIVEDNSAIAMFYGQTDGNVPTQDADLKRMEITLTIKEWKWKVV